MSSRMTRREAGFSLVELLVTSFIAGIVFASMVPVFVGNQKASRRDTVRTVAAVAQDRIEKVRDLDYDDIEFDATKLNSPGFANGQFGKTWPNYETTGEGDEKDARTYYVYYDVNPVPENATPGLEQYKQVSVVVYWSSADPDNPPPATNANSVRMSTFIYRQFAGSRIVGLNIAPMDESEGIRPGSSRPTSP